MRIAEIGLRLAVLLVVTLQLVFTVHENSKFNRYKRGWHKAYAIHDSCNMTRYRLAEELEFDAIVPPKPWLIFTNWNHDYLDDVDAVCE